MNQDNKDLAKFIGMLLLSVFCVMLLIYFFLT